MSSHPIASPHPAAVPVRGASVSCPAPDDLDLDRVLGGLYPDVHQRGAVVAELETLTYLHHSLTQQATASDRLTHLEARIFQLLGVA